MLGRSWEFFGPAGPLRQPSPTVHIFKVTATDGDKDRPENIVYFLTGQGIDTDRPDQSKFDINKTTGEIFVLKVINTVA